MRHLPQPHVSMSILSCFRPALLDASVLLPLISCRSATSDWNCRGFVPPRCRVQMDSPARAAHNCTSEGVRRWKREHEGSFRLVKNHS
eukprot:scaffold297003_cov33-Tisochrysis_lutea.AAC.1